MSVRMIYRRESLPSSVTLLVRVLGFSTRAMSLLYLVDDSGVMEGISSFLKHSMIFQMTWNVVFLYLKLMCVLKHILLVPGGSQLTKYNLPVALRPPATHLRV